MKIKMVFVVGAALLSISACSELGSGPSNGQDGKGWFGSIMSVGDMSELIDDVDTTNVRCVVMLQQDYSELKDWDSSLNVTAWIGHEARAYFHPAIDSSVSIADIEVNGSSLDIGGNGFNYGIDGTGMQSYFNTGSTNNSIKKSTPDAALGVIDTTVSFQQKVRFTGLNRGDTVDLSLGKSFSFTGSGGYMQLLVTISRPDDPNESGGHSFSKVFDGVSGVTLSASDLSNLVSGKGEVTITKWEPKILNTTNDKKIAFVAKTMHTISVEIID